MDFESLGNWQHGLALTLLLGSIVLSVRSWGWGLTAALCIGLLQEPLRKVTPYQPAYMQLLFIPAFVVGTMRHSNLRGELRGLAGARLLVACTLMFASSLCVAIVARFIQSDFFPAAKLVLIGCIAPALLVIGILAGFKVAQISLSALNRAITGIVIVLLLFFVGNVLEIFPQSYQWSESIGPLAPKRPWCRTIGREQFRMLAGFFRSPENAAWFSVILTLGALINAFRDLQPRVVRVLMSASAGIGVMCSVLSGRRKMQVMLMVTIIVMLMLALPDRRRSIKLVSIFGLAIVGTLLPLLVFAQLGLQIDYFLTGPEFAPARLLSATVESIAGMQDSVPFYGLGLGAMAPGNQYVQQVEHLYAEGGVVRIFAESGWFGLILFLSAIVLAFKILLTGFFALHFQNSERRLIAAAAIGLLLGAFLSFCIGHQVYGDPLVCSCLGLTFGFVYRATQKPNYEEINEEESR